MACEPEILREVPLFARLDDDESALLAAQVEVKTFAPRQRIYRIGDPGGRAYVMVSGAVRVTTVDEDQQDVIVDEPTPGQFFAFVVTLAIYTTVNLALGRSAWDPYPFILLNLFLSMLAAIQAPVIMMSQNRQDTKDRLRGELDFEVNRRAEAEIQALATKINALADKVDDVGELVRQRT